MLAQRDRGTEPDAARRDPTITSTSTATITAPAVAPAVPVPVRDAPRQLEPLAAAVGVGIRVVDGDGAAAGEEVGGGAQAAGAAAERVLVDALVPQRLQAPPVERALAGAGGPAEHDEVERVLALERGNIGIGGCVAGALFVGRRGVSGGSAGGGGDGGGGVGLDIVRLGR